MLTNFRVGDRVEDKETHKRGCVTFVFSKLEFRGEFIEVLFATKCSLFRPTAFAKSQRGSHECRSCGLSASDGRTSQKMKIAFMSQAFMRIDNAAVRRRIVMLVQEIGGDVERVEGGHDGLH
jgi:hypothetical protein